MMADHTPRPPSLLAHPSYVASQVSKHGRRHLEAALREQGLLLGHVAILRALDDFGPLSQQQLAGSLDFDKSHLVVRIDEMASQGLVTRTQDPSDRRRNQIALTPAGQAVADQMQPVALESHRGFLDALSAAEQKTLMSLLRRVLAANDADRQRER